MLTLAITCFAYFAVQSTRGSDQFWYLSDTETLTSSGINHSNLTMPGAVLRQNNGSPETPFYHNGPILYINAFISKVTGLTAFTTWKILNFIFALSAAVFTGLLVATYSNKAFGLYAFAIYMLSPLNIWLSVNLLQENFYGFLFSLQLFITTRIKHTRLLQIILLLSLILGAYSHPFFKLIMLAIGISLFLQSHYKMVLTIAVCFVIVLLSDKILFPSSFPPDLKTLVAYSVPGKSNSLWLQSDSNLLVTPQLLYEKFTTALKMQFSDIRVPLLSLVTYSSILAFFVLLYRKNTSHYRLLWLCFIAFGLYSGIVLLLQFQLRYQQIFAPAAVALISLAAFTTITTHTKKLLLGLIFLFFIIDIKLVTTARNDAIKFDLSRQKLESFLENYPSDHRVAFVTTREFGKYLHLVYASKPRQSMILGTDWLSNSGYTKAKKIFQPDIIIYEESVLGEKITDSNKTAELATFHGVGKLFYQEVKNTN